MLPSHNLRDERDDSDGGMVICHLGDLLESRRMTITRLSELAGVSVVNLSILKNNRAKAIRFSTLQAICLALDCQPGDLLVLAQPK